MNRCLDVSPNIQRDSLLRSHDYLKHTDEQMFRFFHHWLIRCSTKAYDCSKTTDEQMFGCLPKIKSDFLLKSHDCLKTPDEQMFGCFTKHYFYSDPMPI